jgi:DNA replication protein DnaC
MSSHLEESNAGEPASKKGAARRKNLRKADARPAPDVLEPAASTGAGEDLENQREFFGHYRLHHARIPRRFWNKTLKSFETGDRTRKRLVTDAEHYIKGFNFKVEFPRGLLMLGEVGSGKSHLAVAILREVIRKGYTGLYYNSPDLLRDIRATFDDAAPMREDDLLEEITGVDLLILDDLGAENVSGFVLDRFYLIVNKRYEGCKPIIVTTNLDEETLRARLGDRILSRLDEMCERFGPFPKEDYRRRFLADQVKSG